jgi:hypothetical protein
MFLIIAENEERSRKMGTEKAELRIVKREVPSRMRAFRLMPNEDRMLEDYARTHEATVSDIVISALRQTGVLPEAGE